MLQATRNLIFNIEEATLAQTQARASSGGGAFFLPQRLIVQLAFTEDTPQGGVIQMDPGWYTQDNLDERALTNPVIAGLVPKDSNEAGRNQARAEMTKKMANGEATVFDMAKLEQEQGQQIAEEQKAATEAWNGKAQEAADKGVPFNEPHPDPAVTMARALTQTQPQYVASGGMQSKISDEVTSHTPPPQPRPTVHRHPAPEPAKD